MGSAALPAALEDGRLGRGERRQQGEVAGAKEAGCHHARSPQRNNVASQHIDRWVVLQASLQSR